MIETILLLGGAAAWWYGKRQEAQAKAAASPAALPASSTPPPVTATPGQIAPVKAPASNGSTRLLWGLAIGYLVLKTLGAIARARLPPSAPSFRINIQQPRRRSRVLRRPGTRGRRQGLWEKKGSAGWKFYPYNKVR